MIQSLVRLFRLRLALLNGVAALGGTMLYPTPAGTDVVSALTGGVILLAAGASALNQVLERDLDRLMERTSQRPLVQGAMQPMAATAIGATTVLTGTTLLVVAGGPIPAAIGVLGIICYLAIYTPMKRHTPYALAIGALCGSLPPLIGWCTLGGDMGDYRILLLSGLLYLWQIPHFWLFQRRHADDFRAAGFPLLTAVTRKSGFTGIFGLWMAALLTATMLMPTLGLVTHSTALWFPLAALPLLPLTLFHFEKALFAYLNTFPLLVTLALMCQR
jgi:protoheme IX farnesyltransferase